MQTETLIPGVTDQCDPNAILFYLYNLYLIELLKKHQPNDVTVQAANQYGKEYLTPWRDDADAIIEFYYQHKRTLEEFQEAKAVAKLKEVYQNTEQLKSYTYRQIPLDISSIRAINNEISMYRGANFWPGIGQTLNQSNATRTIDSLMAANKDKMSWGQRTTASCSPLEIIDSILRGAFNNFMGLNKDNDSLYAKQSFGAERFEVLDPKFYSCFCGLYNYHAESSYGVHFPTMTLIASISFHLRIPTGIHLNSLDRMYEKYVKTHPRYIEAVEKCRRCSDMTPNEALNTDNRTYCCYLQLEEANIGGSTEKRQNPDSEVERYLVLQYLRDQCCRV